jgi:hypothetical protein
MASIKISELPIAESKILANVVGIDSTPETKRFELEILCKPWNIYIKKQADIVSEPNAEGKTSLVTNVTTVIENYEPLLSNTNLYRLCLMRARKRTKEGMKWHVPMFGFNSDGTPKNPDRMRFQYDDTWWYAGAKETAWWYGRTDKYFNVIINTEQHAKKVMFMNRHKTMLIGVALFRRSFTDNLWYRVSNIAKLKLVTHKTPDTVGEETRYTSWVEL